MEDKNCFNCGAKATSDGIADIYFRYSHPNSTTYRKASTITICIECGAAWNAITLATIKKYEVAFRTRPLATTILHATAEIDTEVKRLREKLFEAELWVNNESYTFENDIKKLNDYAEELE
ncbi:MAG: hypothetical protein ACTSWQ_02090 [Candidatus Thorarchaeota archaeon]